MQGAYFGRSDGVVLKNITLQDIMAEQNFNKKNKTHEKIN
jgi:hypothetical protein